MRACILNVAGCEITITVGEGGESGRQQEVVGAMKRRILSPAGFVRMPLIAWKAPQAVKTDMSGFTLLGVAIGQFLPGSGGSHVLKPTGVENESDC